MKGGDTGIADPLCQYSYLTANTRQGRSPDRPYIHTTAAHNSDSTTHSKRKAHVEFGQLVDIMFLFDSTWHGYWPLEQLNIHPFLVLCEKRVNLHVVGDLENGIVKYTVELSNGNTCTSPNAISILRSTRLTFNTSYVRHVLRSTRLTFDTSYVQHVLRSPRFTFTTSYVRYVLRLARLTYVSQLYRMLAVVLAVSIFLSSALVYRPVKDEDW